jgi:hypothetical protein
LDPDNPLPAELLTRVPADHWACLAFESREPGIRFFDRKAGDPVFAAAARAFAAVASLYEPDRARQFPVPTDRDGF